MDLKNWYDRVREQLDRLDFPALLARKELRAPSALPVPPVQSAPRVRRGHKALWVRPF